MAAPVSRPKGGHGARLPVVLRVDADRYPYLLGLRLSPNRSQVRKSNAEAVKADGVQSAVKEVQMRRLVRRAYVSLFLFLVPFRSYLGA